MPRFIKCDFKTNKLILESFPCENPAFARGGQDFSHGKLFNNINIIRK